MFFVDPVRGHGKEMVYLVEEIIKTPRGNRNVLHPTIYLELGKKINHQFLLFYPYTYIIHYRLHFLHVSVRFSIDMQR